MAVKPQHFGKHLMMRWQSFDFAVLIFLNVGTILKTIGKPEYWVKCQWQCFYSCTISSLYLARLVHDVESTWKHLAGSCQGRAGGGRGVGGLLVELGESNFGGELLAHQQNYYSKRSAGISSNKKKRNKSPHQSPADNWREKRKEEKGWQNISFLSISKKFHHCSP